MFYWCWLLDHISYLLQLPCPIKAAVSVQSCKYDGIIGISKFVRYLIALLLSCILSFFEKMRNHSIHPWCTLKIFSVLASLILTEVDWFQYKFLIMRRSLLSNVLSYRTSTILLYWTLSIALLKRRNTEKSISCSKSLHNTNHSLSIFPLLYILLKITVGSQ